MSKPIIMKSIPMPHSGCETSLRLGISRRATLTSDQSLTSVPTICAAMPKPISSPVLAVGQSPLDLPAGPMTDLFGQAHAPASPSAQPARARRPMTDATCGLRGFLSSPSGALQSSLESRLKRRLDGAGSMLFTLTWKARATPARRPYCQLAASARRISETDFGSWPTPVANDDNKTPAAHLAMKKRVGERDGTGANRTAITSFQVMAQTVTLASWGTPKVSTGDYQKDRSGNKILNLQGQAKLANWATPTARDYRSESATDEFNAKRWGHTRGKPLSAEVLLAGSGTTPNGSTAPMEKPGQLDPDHSRWVMGYSAEHLNCAPTETLSFLKSQRNSSQQPNL